MTSGEEGHDWRLVLDANVLLQAPLRDTILRLAEDGVVAVFWSDSLLAEVERNFARVSGGDRAEQRYARLIHAMRAHFPQALVADVGATAVTLGLPHHDRHVLACALDAPASIIVTYNLRHFPDQLLAPFGLRAWHPDTLLIELLRERSAEVRAVLLAQGQSLHPPRGLAGTIERLSRDTPRFAAIARRYFGLEELSEDRYSHEGRGG